MPRLMPNLPTGDINRRHSLACVKKPTNGIGIAPNAEEPDGLGISVSDQAVLEHLVAVNTQTRYFMPGIVGCVLYESPTLKPDEGFTGFVYALNLIQGGLIDRTRKILFQTINCSSTDRKLQAETF